MYEIKIISTQKEILEYQKIRKIVFVEEQKVPYQLEIDSKDTLETTIHVGLYKDGRIVGTGRILDIGADVIHFGRIALLKEFRGLGLGKKIINGMEKIASLKSGKNIIVELNSQIQAENFYKKLGYTAKNSERYFEAGIEHITMYKTIVF